MNSQVALDDQKYQILPEHEELVQRILDVPDHGRQQDLFASYPQLRTESIVEYISDEAVRLMRVDLPRAERAAAVLRLLAEELKTEYSRGRSHRVDANIAHIKDEYRAALQSYDLALECFEQAGNAQEAARTMSSALHSLALLGEYDLAASWANKARDIFEKLGDRLRLAKLEGNLGILLFRQDRWQEAAERFHRAHQDFLAVGEPQDVALCLRNMAVCHVHLNNFMQALDLYEHARSFCQAENLPGLVAEVNYNIAYLHYLRGEYTAAIEIYKETRATCQELGDRYHMALCDLDQAEIFLELNLVEEAAELAQRAVGSFDHLEMRYEKAKAVTNLAIARSREGKAFLALELLAKAREIFLSDQKEVWTAMIDLYEGLVLYRTGRFLEAARLARRALDIFLKSTLPTKAAMCEILLARLELLTGRNLVAREYCRAALARLQPMEVPGLGYQAYYVLGQIEESLENWPAGMEAYKKSQSHLEWLRSNIQTEELKIASLEEKLAVYESLVCLTLQHETSPTPREDVFGYIESAKSRSLADLIAFRADALLATSATRSDQAEQVRKLREELNWYYRQIDFQEMSAESRSLEGIEQLRVISRQQEDHLIQTLRDLQTDQELSSLQGAATVDLETIRSVIPGQTALIEYYIARGTVYACILDRELLEILPITVESKAREVYRLLQFHLSKFRLGPDYVAEFAEVIDEATRAQLQALYMELMAPIRRLLKHRHLVVIPHGFLHYVPFHALFDGQAFMIDQFSISYAPSASVFYFACAKRFDLDNRSLVMGAGGETAPDLTAQAQAIAEMLPNAEVFLGESADAKVLNNRGQGSRFVYIAAEGYFRADNPMFSAIKLGDSEVSFFDLFNLKLRTEMVVLSGCARDLQFIENGDDLVGLTQGLLYAGAQSVIIPLWHSDSESTALFMRAFFKHLRMTKDKAKALQLTIQEFRASYPQPYFWAPYLLVGKPDAG